MSTLLTSRAGRVVTATGWMYGGRAIGLAWTILLISRLGIGDYGRYAMAGALSALVAGPLDHPFNVRAIREDADTFHRERRTRVLLGVAVALVGVALTPVLYVVGVGLAIAGGEIAFNAVKSLDLREGHPQRVNRADALRQIGSVVAAVAYLLLAAEPTLLGVTWCYLAAYLVPLAIGLRITTGVRAGWRGRGRETAWLFAENAGNAAYLQGDVLLLGLLAGTTVAGYFSVCSMVAWSVAALGQAFIATHHSSLRAAHGARESWPPTRQLAALSGLAGTTVAAVAVGLLLLGTPRQLWLTMAVMAAFAALRSLAFVLVTILYLRRSDTARALVAIGAAPVKLALVAVLAGPLVAGGAVGGAVASVVTDLLVVLACLRLVTRPLVPEREEQVA